MSTVLITGANRGLGFEFAKQYAAEGWKVIGTVRKAEDGGRLAALGKNVEIHTADIADRPSLARLARDLKGAPIDVLICNGGTNGRRDVWFGETDYADWEHVHRVNVMGPWATSEALIENVAASALKRIAIVSSQAGSLTRGNDLKRGQVSSFVYKASKVAVNSTMKSMSAMLGERNVVVIALSPGWVRTDMGGPDAPNAPEDSVRGMRKVIANATMDKSGKFFRHTGEPGDW